MLHISGERLPRTGLRYQDKNEGQSTDPLGVILRSTLVMGSSLTAVNVCSDQGLSPPEPKQGLKLNLLHLNIL